MIILLDVTFVKKRSVTKKEIIAKHNLSEDIFGNKLDSISANIHFYDFEKRLLGAFITKVDTNNADVLNISIDSDKKQDIAFLLIIILISSSCNLALNLKLT